MSTNDPYRELFERSADAILIIDGDRFVDCNAAAVKMLHASDKGEVLRTHPSDLSPEIQPDGQPSFERANEMIEIAFARGSHRFEWDHRRVDGEIFPVEVLLTAVNEPGRQVLHVVWRDISERRQLEDALRQAQKMEAVGKIAGGIAHDFNNLLVVMLGNCDLLEMDASDQDKARYVQQIREAGSRAAMLIRQLLTFSRKQEVSKRNIDVVELIGDLETMLGRLLGEEIELQVKASRPAVVFANPNRIEQVVLNLASNARDAMPDGGHLTVTISSDEANEMVSLCVEDDGMGMSDETRKKAFEPFFTTKPTGGGTGLGLATVYGIVQQGGGDVMIESSLGVGTKVIARFPSAGDVRPERRQPPSSGRVAGHGETILIVEDERTIRQIAETLLSRQGFRVLVAANGVEGLEVFDACEEEVALIISDVVMPHMSGAEMVMQLRKQGETAPVLFMSGYTDATLQELQPLGERLDLLEKPFDLNTLASRVRAAIDGGHNAE